MVETGLATLPQSIAAASVNGRIAIIGALGSPPEISLPNFSTIIGKNLTMRDIAEGSRAMLAELVDAVAANGIRPVIDREFAQPQIRSLNLGDCCRSNSANRG